MAKKRRKTKRQLREERQKKLRKRKRIILLTIEIIILAALLVAAYGIFKLGKLDYNVLNKKKLEVYKDTGEYTNIALFGLDSRNNELDGGVLDGFFQTLNFIIQLFQPVIQKRGILIKVQGHFQQAVKFLLGLLQLLLQIRLYAFAGLDVM